MLESVFERRADAQLKLRGYRIEPRQVEAALAEHPAVRASAVIAVRQTLVAFVVAGEAADPEALIAHAAERLPPYMVPTRVVTLDRLPLTPNGKVDGEALRQHPRLRTGLGGVVDPPTTDAERLVAAIWCDVLGVQAVGVDDGFFEIGGDSLLAVEVAARLDRDVPVVALFEHPTVRALARHLTAGDEAPATTTGMERAAQRAAARRRGR